MDKEAAVCVCVCICTHTPGYYLAKKSEIIAFAATWMKLEIIILGETGQKEEDL